MESNGEEEETGPSVDSTDQDERIAARRLRITKRIEIQKRALMGGDGSDKKEVKEELSKSRKQMEESRLRLTKLREDGTELVTNIKVALDARESGRRVEEEEGKRQRKDKLEAEAKGGSERFEEITKKWESALQKEIPQDLHEMLMLQKASCDGMIDEKNKLITDLQVELKQKDDHYVKDLKKHAEDIDLIIERMDEQVKQLTKAYRDELNQIEKSFVAERTEMLESHRKKWEAMMQNRRDKEIEFMKAREKRVEDYEKQLQHLRIQDAEEYNTVKIKLETDVQILEQQLQQMRATYQLNQEKLEYNFQVLRKRDEENTITKSQQKRKITRLQDVLTNLKIKLAKQERTYKDDNSSLSEDYKRITEQFRELQKKSKHFIATDNKKFHDIWCMNEEECKNLVDKIMASDKIIHEQQMGLLWEKPELEFLDNVGPITSEAAKRKAVSAHQVAQEIITTTVATGGSSVHETSSEKGERRSSITITDKISRKVVKNILELLCDESGFLIEAKLIKLLAPLEKDERTLIKLDAIFTALGIDTEDDIYILAGYFQKIAGKTSSRQERPGTDSSMKDPDMLDEEDVDEEISRLMAKPDDETASHHSVPVDSELIHPNDVLKALRSFVEEHKRHINVSTFQTTADSEREAYEAAKSEWREIVATMLEKGRNAQFRIAELEERDTTDDTAYWLKYQKILPHKKDKVWEGILQGIIQYSETLTTRSKLITETDGLRQQNAELRMLLHQYVNSKVNQELEIPPTRVLQLELNQ